MRKRITLISAHLWSQPPPLQKPDDTAGNAFRDPGNLGVAGRANPMEFEVAPVVSDIEAIDRERVEMNIEIQGVPEPLHECDGAASCLAV